MSLTHEKILSDVVKRQIMYSHALNIAIKLMLLMFLLRKYGKL